MCLSLFKLRREKATTAMIVSRLVHKLTQGTAMRRDATSRDQRTNCESSAYSNRVASLRRATYRVASHRIEKKISFPAISQRQTTPFSTVISLLTRNKPYKPSKSNVSFVILR